MSANRVVNGKEVNRPVVQGRSCFDQRRDFIDAARCELGEWSAIDEPGRPWSHRPVQEVRCTDTRRSGGVWPGSI